MLWRIPLLTLLLDNAWRHELLEDDLGLEEVEDFSQLSEPVIHFPSGLTVCNPDVKIVQ